MNNEERLASLINAAMGRSSVLSEVLPLDQYKSIYDDVSRLVAGYLSVYHVNVLPCDIGETVYLNVEDVKTPTGRTIVGTVNAMYLEGTLDDEIEIVGGDPYFEGEPIHLSPTDFGKRLFHTRADAERALRKASPVKPWYQLGDPVYVAHPGLNVVIPCTVAHCYGHSVYDAWVDLQGDGVEMTEVPVGEFGRHIFFTLHEAEQALKEREKR